MSNSILGWEHLSVKYAGTVGILSLSFWSSGVLLIRAFNYYELWGSLLFLGIFFILSIPLVSVSVYGVRRIFSTSGNNTVVYDTLQSVLLMHGFALGFLTKLYSFTPSSEISAAAWLLWFGGVALIFARFKSSS